MEKWKQEFQESTPGCNIASSNSYDLLIFKRGELLKEKPSNVASLLSAVENDHFSQMLLLLASEVRNLTQQEAIRSAEIEGYIQKEIKGFGAVSINAESAMVCMTVPEPSIHKALLKKHSGLLEEALSSPPSFIPTTAEGAFISAQRGQCCAIYGSSADLKLIIDGMKREKINNKFLPIWFSPEDVLLSGKSIEQQNTLLAQQETDQRRRLEDEQKLALEKEKSDGTARRSKEGSLRKQYGVMARAFEGKLSEEINNFLNLKEDRAGRKYPSLASWYGWHLSNKWELVSVNTVLLDYGTSEYKGRTLETAFATSEIRLRNRILGEYKDSCYITGFVADPEFQMEREPFEVTCKDSESALLAYKRGARFISRWNVE
ncbi:hypothetical protein [Pseudochelatococcus sp. G4_1912]|uniref:hypothetical protein n=1 Tax=Pseudochelatococcus sp. G4_1912 TaxID=3114288 RepID=UPI0039C6DBDA